MRLGRRGEEEACSYLTNAGHVILDRNWRSGHLEIDIVSVDRDGIHFVEVKTRMAPYSADPLESVGPTKQRRIIAASKAWLRDARKKNIFSAEVYFDIICVIFEGEYIKVDYYPQAYIPIVI